MQVKRFTMMLRDGNSGKIIETPYDNISAEESITGDYVLASDYDVLLAVLRRCVKAMDNITTAAENWDSFDAALSAAREFTEEAGKWK